MMQASGNWITHEGTQALCAAIGGAGHRALFVGGCVRNALLGLAVTDIDICTDALPETVSDIAKIAGFKVVPTGIAHGTVTIIAGGVAHEVTTFRRDVETDGRRAVVAFSTDIGQDAARRDLTINAIYAAPDGTVIDPLGGLPDLLARRVRFVGDPDQRIREDYLRILRFFRFHAHFANPDEGLDPEALAACAKNLDGLSGLSKERIGHEVRKLLAAPDPAPAVAAMEAAGILAAILPGSSARALAPLVHLEAAFLPDWRRRLAVLGGDDPAHRLKLSRAESRDLSALRGAVGSADSPAAFGFLLQADQGVNAVLVRSALLESALPANWQSEVARGANARFPVRAADLPDLAGPALGARLADLRAIWLRTGLALSIGNLLRYFPGQ